jgi:hypothetical protein
MGQDFFDPKIARRAILGPKKSWSIREIAIMCFDNAHKK